MYQNTLSCVGQIPLVNYAAFHLRIVDLNVRPSRAYFAIVESQASGSSQKRHISVYMAATPEELARQLQEYAQA